ncbi:hypothetical protein P9Y62_24540 [Bacillus thuringiensis]|uniref:Uncharacterized protein n=1 Tax=Bacillus thuringiensis TaxID=1428 RepID=A0A9X5N8U2_BACTU|nr:MULTISPECIES: hypothetical protein [Bacillus cereus group]EEM38243.1 hypothetical protein bthur0004_58840 [Bacillus thuringiensis serovar sotto str. T04001]MBJ8090295.1 hypothetical protein [Bacillus cereus]MEB4894884.1 hypothetical protein [Bacillus thuringiensis]MEC2565345.1 hypothetical protein [Bacillus thuringiensis]MEC2643807.1 hypothetical protein [Bacillus thuringiensis]
MSWNKDINVPIPLKGPDLRKLLIRVRDLEKRGYDHVRPYQTRTKIWKDYEYDMNKNFGKGKYKLSGYEIETEYSFLMIKKVN